MNNTPITLKSDNTIKQRNLSSMLFFFYSPLSEKEMYKRTIFYKNDETRLLNYRWFAYDAM